MIVTVTPSPSLDLTYTLPDDSMAEVNRTTRATLEASGKGVNLSRALVQAGVPTVAVVAVGGSTGHQLLELLHANKVSHRHVTVEGDTRINTTILRPASTSKFNAPGGAMTPSQVAALLSVCGDALDEAASDDYARSWLAVCGSLPPGADHGLIADLVRLAADRGVPCAVDTSGSSLSAALTAGADLVAPNVSELAEISPRVRRALDANLESIASATATFAAESGCAVLLSCGESGAIWTDGAVTLHGHGPDITPVNTAGAGDALLAGWLAEPGGTYATGIEELSRRLARAVAWGSAACLSASTVCPTTPTPSETAAVVVRRLSG